MEFDALLAAHLPFLRQQARRYVRTETELEDLVQETCLKALRSKHTFNGNDSAFRGWLRRVCYTVFADDYHERYVRRRHGRHYEWRDWQHRAPAPIDTGLTDEMTKALASLTPENFAACWLINVLDYSAHEAGALLGLPPATVLTRAFRGRKGLRRRLASMKSNIR